MPDIYEGQTLVIRGNNMPTKPIITNAYVYPFVTRETLNITLPYLSYITPFTYGFEEDGNLIDLDDVDILSAARDYGTKAVMHISTLTKTGRFSNELSSALFNNENAQDALLTNIINTMQRKGYVGLDIDFEYVLPDQAVAYADFISKANQRLNEYGYFLITALAPKTSADQTGLLYEGHNYSLISQASDYVFIMTYEWGYAYGPPLAVSPINQVQRVLSYALTETEPNKIYLGVPNYGYDWTLPYMNTRRAKTISNKQAVEIAYTNRASIEFNETYMSPYFRYTAEGNVHEVWFEDARFYKSIFDLIRDENLRGFAVWNGMNFNPQLWLLANSEFLITDF